MAKVAALEGVAEKAAPGGVARQEGTPQGRGREKERP